MSDLLPGEIRFSLLKVKWDGWTLLDGKLIDIAGAEGLFGVVGYDYTPEGEDPPPQGKFYKPDMRGLFPYVPVDPTDAGKTGGKASHKLTIANLPPHSHTVLVNSGDANNGDESTPVLHYPGGATTDRFYTNTNANGKETSLVGDADPVPTVPPYMYFNVLTPLLPNQQSSSSSSSSSSSA